MNEIKLEATGKDHDALVEALEEALRLVKNGNLQGFDKNEDGSFYFDINEKEKHPLAPVHAMICPKCQSTLRGTTYYQCNFCDYIWGPNNV
jgi:hypothetical protein